jgi:recombination protein RecA
MYGKGISQSGELVDMAVDKDIIDKSGSWYSYGEERIGQGRENAKTYLEEHKDMYDEIMKKVRTAYDIPDDADSGKTDSSKKSSAKKTEKKTDKKDSKRETSTTSSKETKVDSIDLDIGK